MIDAQTMMNKIGKKKFIDLATHSQPKQTGAYLQKLRRFGKSKHKMCQHGIWIIENYERKECKSCTPFQVDGAPALHLDSAEYFNAGTGTYGTNKEHRKYARQLGLREAG